MSPKFDAMQALLAERNHAYTMLALIALSLVIAWIGVDWLPVPDRLKSALRNGYMLGGMGLYLFTLIVIKPFG